MTLAEYEAALELAAPGATYTIAPPSYAFSSIYAKDEIISVDPPSPTLVVPDQVITAVISLGPLQASRWHGVFPELAQAAVESTEHSFAVMAHFAIDGDPTYICDAEVTIDWAGHKWIGVGKFGTIDGPNEALDLVADPVRFVLSGCDPGLVAAANDPSKYKGRAAEAYMAMLHPRTAAVINEPNHLWSGKMDVMWLEGDRNSATIRLDCERRYRRQPTPRRFTDQDQRLRNPGDLFFSHLPDIPNYKAGGGGGSIIYSGPGRNRERDQPRPP